MNEFENNTLMSIQQLCDYLCVSNDTLYRWINAKNFPARMIGKRWKAAKEDVDTWVKTHSIGKTSSEICKQNKRRVL